MHQRQGFHQHVLMTTGAWTRGLIEPLRATLCEAAALIVQLEVARARLLVGGDDMDAEGEPGHAQRLDEHMVEIHQILSRNSSGK